jgi:5'-nucleotidase
VLPGLPDVPATAVDAPPVFAVLAACTGALGARPDLVISGINDGFNTGRFLLASSTVGAALAGGALGVRGLAISAGFAPHHRFDTAAMIAVRTAEWMIEHSAPRTVLNVNVPDCGVEEIAGVRCAELAPRGLMGLRLDRRESELVLRQFVNDDGLGEGTDAALVAAGYVAVNALPSLSRVAHGDAAARSAEAIECGLRTGRTPRAETSC